MEGQDGVVGFDDGIRNLRGGNHRVGAHNTIRIFLPDLRDHQSSHTLTSTSTQAVAQLEALQAVASLSLFPDNIENRVNQFLTFSVVPLGPVVTSTGLPEDEVIRSEQLTEWSCSNTVHGTGFQVNQNGTGNVSSSGLLVEIDVDPLQLQIGVTMVGTGRINTMFIGNNFPELGPNLITTLAGLGICF